MTEEKDLLKEVVKVIVEDDPEKAKEFDMDQSVGDDMRKKIQKSEAVQQDFNKKKDY